MNGETKCIDKEGPIHKEIVFKLNENYVNNIENMKADRENT
jgi:hypothetical protein